VEARPEALDDTMHILGGMDEADQRMILGENARKLYGIGG
jgi:predicted TIM-barrel fold metal-dependent hydrolase